MSEASAAALYAMSGVLIGVSVITVTMRFYARRCQKAPLLADDWLLIPSLITFIGTCACIFYGGHIQVFGYSTHDFTPEQLKATKERSAKTQIALNLLSIASLGFVKLSALFFYKRILCVSGGKASLNITIITSIAVVICWVVTFEFLIGFQCHTHFSALWDGTQRKYCTYAWPALLAQAISDFLLDVWVLVLPIYPVMKLQATIYRKIAIYGILLLACAGVGASIARLVIFVQLQSVGQAAYDRIDPQRSISQAFFYMILEVGVGLITVCLPSIWLVFTSAAPEAFLQSDRSVVSLASLHSKPSEKTQEPSSNKVLQSSKTNSSIA